MLIQLWNSFFICATVRAENVLWSSSASSPRGCTRVFPEVEAAAAAAAAAIQSDPTFEERNISHLLSDPSLHKKMAVEDAAAKDVPPIPEEEGAGEVTAGMGTTSAAAAKEAEGKRRVRPRETPSRTRGK